MLIWSLVWIEIPLVATIYKKLKLKTVSIISDIFTFDYIWWLLASLLFPLILLPYFWLYNIAIFIWGLNLLVWLLYIKYINWKKIKNINLSKYYFVVFWILIYLLFLIFTSTKLENFYLRFYYKEPVLESFRTDYQDIVLTKKWEDFRMYINWNIQFMSLDENRYHEALVDWPIKIMNKEDISVLVLGWWDWLAVRNLLNYDYIDEIILVELDPKMSEISMMQKDLVKLNKDSLRNSKVKIINTDAFKYILDNEKKFDFIIADFPDPRDVWTAKLYSKEFYIWIEESLKNDWIFVTQSSNAFFSNRAMFSIDKTINDVFLNSLAYHRYLPSFWDWWFILAQKWWLSNINICPNMWCTYFDEDYIKDRQNIEINTLTKPVLIEYYWEWYRKFNL